MHIEGKKLPINKSPEELYQFLIQAENFKELMPDNVDTFEANEDGFIFSLKGMPKVALQLDNAVEYKEVTYKSAKESVDFTLSLNISPNADTSFLQIDFVGNFNSFIRMMVEKPLTNFIHTLEENAQQL